MLRHIFVRFIDEKELKKTQVAQENDSIEVITPVKQHNIRKSEIEHDASKELDNNGVNGDDGSVDDPFQVQVLYLLGLNLSSSLVLII